MTKKLPFNWILFTDKQPLSGEFVNLWFKKDIKGKPHNTFAYATFTGDRYIFEGHNRSNDLEDLYAWRAMKA